MRIKQITAANMTEALAQIKSELGDDAIIVSSEKAKDGSVQVSVALDEAEELFFDDNEQLDVVSSSGMMSEQHIRDCLEYHGVLDVVSGKILATIRQEQQLFPNISETEVLEKTLTKLYAYGNMLDIRQPVKIFMGTPGSGKSTAIAKVATQAKINGVSCCIISTDNVRAGANKQLEAYAKILEVDFYFCKDAQELSDKVNACRNKYNLILIDTPGINPFIEKEIKRVTDFCQNLKGQKILTLDAGRNPMEAVEIGEVFMDIGARYLLPTRLDLTRRIGTVLSVAACCDMSFYAASVSASIANGLAEINSASLTKLILSEV